jgi:regulation of enolase protein 1 (concanavalin A-like superfamily)
VARVREDVPLTDVAWAGGSWLNPPPAARVEGSSLLVTAAEGSDFWRTTSYGFIHDDGHALLVDFPDRTAIEVSFLLDYDAQFDQAGVLVRGDERSWVKAGVEVSDGIPQVGAVVTREVSDWSVAPVADWVGREVTIRASRDGDALTIRARADGAWQLVRLVPLASGVDWRAGPFCCAPTRDGLEVQFKRFATGPADAALHG